MKKILRVLSLVLILTMLFSVPVYAIGGSGDDGKVTTGTKEKRDGFLYFLDFFP